MLLLNVLLAREESREAWLGLLDTWLQDVRHSARMIRRSPGAAAVVVLTMATAIGMNAAIFGVFHAVLLRPLPHPDPERLVWLSPYSQRFNIDTMVSRPDFVIWRDRAKSFERMAAYGQVDVAFFTSGHASEEQITLISDDFWAMTGATAALGRLFGPDEQDAVVLTHRTFERKFNGEPAVLGTTVTLSGYPVTIVGVLARDYRVAFPAVSSEYLPDSAAYIALPNTPSQPGAADRSIPGGRPVSAWVRVVGKLRPDAAIERARTEFQGIFDQIARDFPTPLREGRTHRVVPLLEKVVGPVETPLKILLVAVALLLTIATTNIAHVLLTRSLSRQAEIGARIAVGRGSGPEFEEPPREIIGVVGDVHDGPVGRPPQPAVYVPAAQLPDRLTARFVRGSIAWIVRTQGNPQALAPAVERELQQASGGLPTARVRSMEEIWKQSNLSICGANAHARAAVGCSRARHAVAGHCGDDCGLQQSASHRVAAAAVSRARPARRRLGRPRH